MRYRIDKMFGLVACVLTGVATTTAATASAATFVPNGSSFTTVFGPSSTIGAAVPDTESLNGLEAFTNFGVSTIDSTPALDTPLEGTANLGETLLFQSGPFYVGGAGPSTSNPLSSQGLENLGGTVANNRAYGFVGNGRSDITFDVGVVDELTVQVRGTEDGTSFTGTNTANTFGGQPFTSEASVATFLLYTDFGLESSLEVSNDSYSTFSFDISSLAGDSITRISLVNQGGANSAVVLGELTVSTVPEPASAALLAAGTTLLAVRRRR